MGFVAKAAEGIGNTVKKVTEQIPGGNFLASAVPGLSLFQNIGNIGQIFSNPAEALKLGASLAFPGAGPLMNTLMPIAQNMLEGGKFDFNQIAGALTAQGSPFANLPITIPDFVREGAQKLTSSSSLMETLGLLGGADGLKNPMQALATTLAAAGVNPLEVLLGEQAGQVGRGIAGLGDTSDLKQILQILAPLFGGAGQSGPLVAPRPSAPQSIGPEAPAA